MSHPLFNLFFDDGGQQLYEDKNRVPPFGHETVFLFLNLKILYLLILEREKGRERKERRKRNISLLYHLLIHSLVDSCMWPDWGSNQQLWHMGQHSNQLSQGQDCFYIQYYSTLPVSPLGCSNAWCCSFPTSQPQSMLLLDQCSYNSTLETSFLKTLS